MQERENGLERSGSFALLEQQKLRWVVRDTPRCARLKHLAAMYNNPRYSDSRLIPQPANLEENSTPAKPAASNEVTASQPPQHFFAQRAILASWSPVFDSIFYSDNPETFGDHFQKGEMYVEATADVVDLFLTYIHKGEITLTMDSVWPLYCFVNTYQVADLVDAVEDIMDKAVSINTCCQLLASASKLGSYDHYALRKCLNMLLMDFPEVVETPGFLTLEFDVLCAIVKSDELNASEECVFEGCMRWIAADEQRVDMYLDALLESVRLPLMDMKFVAALDSHPIAAKSRKLGELMLQALKFAVAPRGVPIAGKPNFRQRKGGLYWKKTKNNMCMDIGSSTLRTFVLNTSVSLVECWKLKIELFEEGNFVVGICEEHCDTDYYVGRFKNGWGLADNGHFYAGGCKCDSSVKHLCTPLCQGHLVLGHNSVVSIRFNKETSDLIFRTGLKVFTQRLQGLGDKRLFPAVSVKNAKVRIFKDDAELLE